MACMPHAWSMVDFMVDYCTESWCALCSCKPPVTPFPLFSKTTRDSTSEYLQLRRTTVHSTPYTKQYTIHAAWPTHPQTREPMHRPTRDAHRLQTRTSRLSKTKALLVQRPKRQRKYDELLTLSPQPPALSLQLRQTSDHSTRVRVRVAERRAVPCQRLAKQRRSSRQVALSLQ